MRYNGLNILAIAVAALVMYGLEYLIFGVLVTPAQFATMAGLSDAQQHAGMARMPLGVIMPVLAAIGIALVIKWRATVGATAGAITAMAMAVLLAFSARMYSYVYGPHTDMYLLIDFGRYVATYGVAGAIIGAWR